MFFSDKLLKDFNEFKSKVENEVLDFQKKNVIVVTKVDEIFDCFEKSVLKLLAESRKRVKKLLSGNSLEVSTLDAFQKDLIDFTCENITSKVKIIAHIKKFSERLHQFSHIRQSFENPILIPENMTRKLIESTKEKLSSLQEIIKKFIEEDLSEKELKEMTMSTFDFNTKKY